MHPLTAAITEAVTEFSANHQSLRQLMINTLVAIVEGKVGPLLADATNSAQAVTEQRDAIGGALERIRERVLHQTCPVQVNDILSIIDDEAPGLVDEVVPSGNPLIDMHNEVLAAMGSPERLVPLVGGGTTTLPLESKREVMDCPACSPDIGCNQPELVTAETLAKQCHGCERCVGWLSVQMRGATGTCPICKRKFISYGNGDVAAKVTT